MVSDNSLLIFSRSNEERSLDEINDALISPLLIEQNLKKLSKIFSTKKILLFSIINKKNFFKLFENSNFLLNKPITSFC